MAHEPDDLDFFPFGPPPASPYVVPRQRVVAREAVYERPTSRDALRKAGPLGTNRDDAAVAERDNARARNGRA